MTLCFLTGITSLSFLLVEIFRIDDNKSSLENIFEGSILLVLVVGWIPTVVVATMPGKITFRNIAFFIFTKCDYYVMSFLCFIGGAASTVGNTFYLTWYV